MSRKIPQSERRFLQQVADLMFSNPFEHNAAELEAITGEVWNGQGDDHVYVMLKPKLTTVMHTLRNKGIDSIKGLSSEDQHLFSAASLFLIYDNCIDDFDALIQEQIDHPDKTLKVKFYQRVLSELNTLGFDPEKCSKYFALFYQLRRAFIFINRGLKGKAACVQQLRRDLWNNIFTSDALLYVDNLWNRMEDFSTLLLGETGTGKGAAAKAIGRSGLIPFDESSGTFRAKFTDSFVSINLLEFPESLIESELFGHTKGAFTGATGAYEGLFKRCNAHGALFLDEIGDVNISIQIKLLKVLQERSFSPVGAHEHCRFSGRVIAATNRNLEELRDRGEFRNDFYYRLSSDVIAVPSLRERLAEAPDELAVLVTSLVERLTGNPAPAMAERVLAQLQQTIPPHYSWPGNVRELEQAVRRTILGRAYRGEPLPTHGLPTWLNAAANGELTANELLAEYCQMLYQREGSYEKVAAKTGFDRRTVKKYIGDSSNSISFD